MKEERELWERKYREGSHSQKDPDSFLLQVDQTFVQPAFPHGGRVLDVAGGIGRHALFYARRGWQATMIDISETATANLKQVAEGEKLSIAIYTADLDEFRLTGWKEQFDLVLVFFYLQRKLFPALEGLLRRGGLLIYKTHLRSRTNSKTAPSHPLHVLEPGELMKTFATMEILHYRERLSARSTAELVARKR
jgi:2-polyprenyl-3-methyl-5-hydroxy-6-metoxy-1,4-benzoquinol methylase